jgi:RNA polymerase sigma-70 factor (ECF subfamily)
MDTPSDAELLQRVRQGDGDAFSALVRRYSPLVHAIALSRTGRREAAEELAQDAFCRAYERLDELRRPGSFRPWLWKIAHRVCSDWQRHREKDMAALPASLTSGDDPVAEAQMAERHRRVREAVDGLPEKYRIVVQLRHLQGMSYEEIAAMLGLSTSGVSNRLAEARERLRLKLRSLVKE